MKQSEIMQEAVGMSLRLFFFFALVSPSSMQRLSLFGGRFNCVWHW